MLNIMFLSVFFVFSLNLHAELSEVGKVENYMMLRNVDGVMHNENSGSIPYGAIQYFKEDSSFYQENLHQGMARSILEYNNIIPLFIPKNGPVKEMHIGHSLAAEEEAFTFKTTEGISPDVYRDILFIVTPKNQKPTTNYFLDGNVAMDIQESGSVVLRITPDTLQSITSQVMPVDLKGVKLQDLMSNWEKGGYFTKHHPSAKLYGRNIESGKQEAFLINIVSGTLENGVVLLEGNMMKRLENSPSGMTLLPSLDKKQEVYLDQGMLFVDDRGFGVRG